jgi:hypothetical protein
LLLAMMAGPRLAVADQRFGPQVDTIRCGRELVKVGDDSFQVLDKCGDPDFRQVVQINKFSDSIGASEGDLARTLEDSAYLVTEQWVYKQGRGRLIKVLTITGGVLTDIRLSERQ